MINKKDLIEKIDETLNNIKSKPPLTHCITNFVTVNDCANAVLAIGGSPIMADDANEMEEVVSIADALVINIGKLSKDQIAAIMAASKIANKTNTPIILDPVGVGVSDLRNNTALKIINNYNVSAIRGNITEIKTIAKLLGIIDENNTAKGVDVCADDIITKDNLNENAKIISDLAEKLNTVILASGSIDILSDGITTLAIDNGDEMMPLITGSGCMLSSIVGTCIGGSTPFEGTLLAILAMNIAGEKARAKTDEKDEGTGSFRAYLIDYLYKTDSETLIKQANIEII